jgi:hypothetical protein
MTAAIDIAVKGTGKIGQVSHWVKHDGAERHLRGAAALIRYPFDAEQLCANAAVDCCQKRGAYHMPSLIFQ